MKEVECAQEHGLFDYRSQNCKLCPKWGECAIRNSDNEGLRP
jgi:hypothetical protein